jgi:hypothetical protein
MRDSANLQDQLAKEEAALAAANQQVEAAHTQIEALHAQIAATQSQIEATHGKIAKLQEHAETISKRIALLREYMTMVENEPHPAVTPVPMPSPVAAPQAAPVQAAPEQPAPAASVDEGLGELLPDLETPLEEELGSLELSDTLVAPTDGPTKTEGGPLNFEEVDEELLTSELLPRTQTFEEELILVMAYHRKPAAPKDVARIFKRLDYAPKQAANEKAIKAQVEASQHFFEYAAEGRIALTGEGREEAQQLLMQFR